MRFYSREINKEFDPGDRMTNAQFHLCDGTILAKEFDRSDQTFMKT
jgi:hypothetical protein